MCAVLAVDRSGKALSIFARRLYIEAMDVTVVEHPLLSVSLSTLRDRGTSPADFRDALTEISTVLILEAASRERVSSVRIETPLAGTDGAELGSSPVLVPILRAGLGMLYPGLTLMPTASVGFIGLSKDPRSLVASCYMSSLPESLRSRPIYLLDPMLATGGSASLAIRMLAERGASEVVVVCAIAAPEALSAIRESSLPVARIVTANIDEGLNDVGFIVPGLGDAGDRQFGMSDR